MDGNDGKQRFVAWLKDAYAMEQAFVEAQERQLDQVKDHPALLDGIKRHLEETRHHAELNQQSLEELGESPSGVKSGLATVTGMVQGMTTIAAKDKAVKIDLNNHTVEQFEIACYKALLRGAERLGYSQIAERCRRILEDETAMAALLDELLPGLVDEAVGTGST